MQKELMLFFSFHASTGPRCGLFGQDSPPLAADGAFFEDERLTLLKVGRIPDMEFDRRAVHENVVTGCELQSNSQVVMTSYGNEYKVFGATGHVPGGQADRGKTNQWAFVDEHWSERMIDAAKEKDGLEISKGGAVYKADPVAMYRAEAQLAHLDVHGAGEDRYAVLSRDAQTSEDSKIKDQRPCPGESTQSSAPEICIPFEGVANAVTALSIRALAARLRRMCAASDEKGTGIISTHIFHGLLEESQQLQALFGCDEAGNPTDQSSDLINYHRFIRLMGANMSNFRLEDSAIAAMVDITHLQRYFCPEAFPKAKDGSMSRDEAREEFLRQWELEPKLQTDLCIHWTWMVLNCVVI
eukprot:g32555.t1